MQTFIVFNAYQRVHCCCLYISYRTHLISCACQVTSLPQDVAQQAHGIRLQALPTCPHLLDIHQVGFTFNAVLSNDVAARWFDLE
jgi:hypothetical protein